MRRWSAILLSLFFLFIFNISFSLTEKDFRHSLNFYKKLVEKKVSVEELIFTLEKIISKYKDIGVNLTPIREKLLGLKAFKTSKDSYVEVEERGAGLDERISVLKGILNKFRNIDADLSGIEKRLKQLEEFKAGGKESLEKFEEFRIEEDTATATIKEDFEEFRLEEDKVEKSKKEKGSESETEEKFEEFRP